MLDEEVDEGAEFWLGVKARRVHHVDAQFFHRKAGQDCLEAAIFHSFVVEEAGEIGDAEASLCRLQQRLAVVYGQAAAGADQAFFTTG